MGRLDQLFRRKTQAFLGVDISAARVKLLELDGRPGAFRVLSYASEPLPADAIADHQVVDAEAVAAALSRALEKSGTRTRDAAIAVSGPAVISKVIDMPADMSDADMEQQIGFDAEQYVPHPIEEVNLDFQVLERDPSNPDVNRVLLVACRRDNIELRTAAMEMARLKVRLVDVEEYALQNACQLLMANNAALSDAASIAVFDIGAQRTRLSVQHNGRSAYTRELGFGGQSLGHTLVEQHGLTDSEQLRTQLRTGDLNAEMIAGEVAQFAQRAAGQIERAIQFYVSAAAGEQRVDHVVLVGGTALFPGMESAIGDYLSTPVSVGNPLAGMLASTAARRNHVERDGPALMVCAGLAMRSIQ